MRAQLEYVSVNFFPLLSLILMRLSSLSCNVILPNDEPVTSKTHKLIGYSTHNCKKYCAFIFEFYTRDADTTNKSVAAAAVF